MEYDVNETQFWNTSSKTANSCNETVTENKLKLQSIVTLLAYSVIMLLSVSGNAYVFYMVVKSKQRSRFAIFLSSLALADLLSSIFLPTLSIYDLLAAVNGSKWYLGAAMCQWLPAATPMLLMASSWSLVAISIERYRVVIWPLSRRERKRTAWFTLLAVWSFAAVISTPYAFTWRMQGDTCIEVFSYLSDKQTFAYLIAITVLIWVIPCFILIAIYTLIAKELKRSEIQHDNNQAMTRKIKQNKQVVRMFVWLVSLFSLLSFPYTVFFCVVRYIRAYNIELLHTEDRTLLNLLVLWNTILFIPCLINSAINPIIYAKMYPGKNRLIRRCVTLLHSKFQSLRRTTREFSLETDTAAASIKNRYASCASPVAAPSTH